MNAAGGVNAPNVETGQGWSVILGFLQIKQ